MVAYGWIQAYRPMHSCHDSDTYVIHKKLVYKQCIRTVDVVPMISMDNYYYTDKINVNLSCMWLSHILEALAQA